VGFEKKILPQYFRAGTVDVHLCKFVYACCYLALTACVKIRKGSPKAARNEQVCAHQKSGCKFSKIVFEQLNTGWIVVVHLYYGFSLWRQTAPQLSAKFRTAFFGQFRVSLRKDSDAKYASILAMF